MVRPICALTAVEEWNRDHPEGTRVRWWRDRSRRGRAVDSVTRSNARELFGSALVWVDGRAESLLLSQVEVRVVAYDDAGPMCRVCYAHTPAANGLCHCCAAGLQRERREPGDINAHERFVVQLRPGVWLVAGYAGDHGRTELLVNAQRWASEPLAARALDRAQARRGRPLSDAKVVRVRVEVRVEESLT